MPGKPKAAPAKSKPKVLTVHAKKDESEAETMARVMVAPYLRHGIIAHDLTAKGVGKLPGSPDIGDFSAAVKAKAKLAREGDLGMVSDLLVSQALSLDAMMTELMRRSTMNFGDYPQAAERYARLAFKAQSNSRAALEALVKLHQPREQTVKHVHVNQGGQAVVADQVHQHTEKLGHEKVKALGTSGAASRSEKP